MEFNGRPIRMVAGQHGNEKGPIRALEYLDASFEVGNPRAVEQNLRFIDQDLNASFGTDSDNYESTRAKELLERIPSNELVIDFHTTSAEGPPFIILTDRAMIPFAERTGLKYAVLMTHNIKDGHALINFRDGFSVEISGYDTEGSFNVTLMILEHLESGKSSPLQIYEVFERIEQPGDYRNFEESVDGTFPILVGEDSYDFIGLRARKLN